jgi:hypothetical protein
MLKLLIGLPLLLIAGALAFGLALPLLALLPVLFALGGVVLAVVVVFGALGLVLRLVAAIVVGAGGLLVLALGLGFFFAGGVVLLALGSILAHLLLPLLIIGGLIWLIRRTSRPIPPALPAPPPA